jgi:hypothetical protein
MKANIDKIIEKSLKKTEEMEKQLKSIEDKFNLNKVSLTGEDEHLNTKTTIYHMDGEQFTRKDIEDKRTKNNPVIIDIGPRNKG